MARLKQKGAAALLEQRDGETAQGSGSSELTVSTSAAPSNSNGDACATTHAPNRALRRAAASRARKAGKGDLEQADGAQVAHPLVDPTKLIVTLTLGEVAQGLLQLGVLAQHPAAPPEVLTPQEAADLLRCSLSTLWRLERDGLIRPRVISGSRRYLRAELLSYVELAHAPEVPHG